MKRPSATPAQRHLAAGLKRLQALQRRDERVFLSREFSREGRQALEEAGFLRRVIKGWYVAALPGEGEGHTTEWHASFWHFVGRYCEHRFKNRWHVSAEASLLIHAGTTALPRQVVVMAEQGHRNLLELPFGTSLFDATAQEREAAENIETLGRLRVLSVPVALVRVSDVFFRTYPLDAQIVLAQVPDVSDLLRVLLAGNHSTVAGRLAGAFRAAHRPQLAEQIVSTMHAAGHHVAESNPFANQLAVIGRSRTQSPYVHRIRLMWARMRLDVAAAFPRAPGIHADPASYLESVDDAYQVDAYHSLSIEGYAVTDALIERVARGNWNPERHERDERSRDAMAAYGYYLAHRAVRDSIARVLGGDEAGVVAERDHSQWYVQLFKPSVTANLLRESDLAGYRSSSVYIRNATHVPPSAEAVRDMMPILFELLTEEENAAVRAVLGHFMFVFIHPYMDGNGRIGRFLMNTMLASGGYPWTVLPVERRQEYMYALEMASSGGDIGPFARFVASCVHTGAPRRA